MCLSGREAAGLDLGDLIPRGLCPSAQNPCLLQSKDVALRPHPRERHQRKRILGALRRLRRLALCPLRRLRRLAPRPLRRLHRLAPRPLRRLRRLAPRRLRLLRRHPLRRIRIRLHAQPAARALLLDCPTRRLLRLLTLHQLHTGRGWVIHHCLLGLVIFHGRRQCRCPSGGAKRGRRLPTALVLGRVGDQLRTRRLVDAEVDVGGTYGRSWSQAETLNARCRDVRQRPIVGGVDTQMHG